MEPLWFHLEASVKMPRANPPLAREWKNLEPLLWLCVSLFFAVGAVWLSVRAIRWAKKGSKAGSMLAAAAFPFPGQPPPQEQVEQENRLKKSTESGDPEE